MQAFYIVISIILGVLYAAFPDEKLYVGFFGRIGIFILATIFAYVGTLVGDYLRKIAIPDSIITTGGMSQIFERKAVLVYWSTMYRSYNWRSMWIYNYNLYFLLK